MDPFRSVEFDDVDMGPTWTDRASVALSWVGVVWYCFVWIICAIGYIQIRKRYYRPPPPSPLSPAGRPITSANTTDDIRETLARSSTTTSPLPFVSILRPIKGLDPHLALTLNSTFLLDYPAHLHELLISVASPDDPCVPVVRALLARHNNVTARLIFGEEDVGPNPKLRTLSRAYREARGDIVWMLDSNVWVAPGVLSRGVRTLCGLDASGRQTRLPYKFVHHLPVAVNCEEEPVEGVSSAEPVVRGRGSLGDFGGRLEETFLSTAHCKFYTAINTVAVAPCTLGKSNMFRKSHLAAITSPAAPGILHFAHNICEDHMLGERLWLKKLPEEITGDARWGKHAMGDDLVFQPIARMTVEDYFERRTRWLRVRKYATIAATLVEPATECFLCSLIGSYGLNSLLNNANHAANSMRLPLLWLTSVTAWSICDYVNFKALHRFENVVLDKNTPLFIRMPRENRYRRAWEGSICGWLAQWLGREALALPIFLWAMLPGPVVWRGRKYEVGWDMIVKEVGDGINKTHQS